MHLNKLWMLYKKGGSFTSGKVVEERKVDVKSV